MDSNKSLHTSKGRETVDCFNCSASRRCCDRVRHRCETCTRSSETCGGYPRDWQWLGGVKARGKQKGTSMSITASNPNWQSTTPSDRMFKFKQASPHKKKGLMYVRKSRVSRSGKAANANGLTVAEEPTEEANLSGVQLCNSASSFYEHHPTPSTSSPTSMRDGNMSLMEEVLSELEPATARHADPPLDGLDYSVFDDIGCDESDTNTTMPALQLEAIWFEDMSQWTTSEVPGLDPFHHPSPRLSSTLLSDKQTLEALVLYDTQLCVLPLTYDYDGNPLRFVSCDSEHSLHAVLAFCAQYLSRIQAASPAGSAAQQAVAYRNAAAKACATAPSAVMRQKQAILDTTVSVFNFDSFTSATGPWHERLTTAFQRIESLGGLDTLASSPRFRGQLTMLVWWDCNISLFTRTEPVFPPRYHDFAIQHDDNTTPHVFALSGVPKELVQYFRELASLASEKEQVEKMKYATFDTTRVLELERSIRDFSIDECIPKSGPNSEEHVQTWYDYYHGTNAWKYGLLLYIARVLKWDRAGEPCRHEIASLSRLVLDSVRCCRADSGFRKQFLHPVFLAAAESSDAYSQNFVIQYFEEWYQLCVYSMFNDALDLLREIWKLKDQNNNDPRIWWGSVASKRPSGSTQLLLG